jgi:hypothetical protein
MISCLSPLSGSSSKSILLGPSCCPCRHLNFTRFLSLGRPMYFAICPQHLISTPFGHDENGAALNLQRNSAPRVCRNTGVRLQNWARLRFTATRMSSLLKMWRSRTVYMNLVRTSKGSTVVAPNDMAEWNLESSCD